MEHITFAGIEIPKNSPFMSHVRKGETIIFNDKGMSVHIFNTIRAYHQVGLWLKTNKRLIPYRGWKIRDIYQYYGLPMKRDHSALMSLMAAIMDDYFPNRRYNHGA